MEVLSRMCDWKTAASRYFDERQQQYQISPGKCFNLCVGCSEILHNHPFFYWGSAKEEYLDNSFVKKCCAFCFILVLTVGSKPPLTPL